MTYGQDKTGDNVNVVCVNGEGAIKLLTADLQRGEGGLQDNRVGDAGGRPMHTGASQST